MESVMKIRRQVLVQERSIRKVAKETGLSRNTIRKYLRDDNPPNYQRKKATKKPKLSGYEERLKSWYEYDLTRPKRERRTAQKLYEQLKQEGYSGSYSPVRRFIGVLKQAHSLSPQQAFIPLQFKPGDAMQFDWSEESVFLRGCEQRIKLAHFRLAYSRKLFLLAYLRESQEMVLDAFVSALSYFQGVPNRVLIDNATTMVVKVGIGKERKYHPRFLAMLNHYLIEPVACNPASGWEKGQVERQVNTVRNQVFKPKRQFSDLSEINKQLLRYCQQVSQQNHPDQKAETIEQLYQREGLRTLGKPFDGYVNKRVRVSSTCLVQYDTNRYSVPVAYARQEVSIRIYAERIAVTSENQIVAIHRRSFDKHTYTFEAWHYVPLLERKPGALRDGAPFVDWALPDPLLTLKAQYLQHKGGDKAFVDLLLLVQVHGMETVTMACELAIEHKTVHLPAVVNLVNQLVEAGIDAPPTVDQYPKLNIPPQANCQRYETLVKQEGQT